MACLFGHKWNEKGCKCEKCGQEDASKHVYKDLHKSGLKQCVACGLVVVVMDSYYEHKSMLDEVISNSIEILKKKSTAILQGIQQKLESAIFLFSKEEIIELLTIVIAGLKVSEMSDSDVKSKGAEFSENYNAMRRELLLLFGYLDGLKKKFD